MNMNPRDLFLLAIRILGLVFLYHGLMALPTTLFGACASLFGHAALGPVRLARHRPLVGPLVAPADSLAFGDARRHPYLCNHEFSTAPLTATRGGPCLT